MPPHLLPQFLGQFAPLTEADWMAALPHFRVKNLIKGEFFLSPGAISQEMALVAEGLLRLYYPLANGQEQTMLFFREGSVAGDYFSFLTQTPTLRPCKRWSPLSFGASSARRCKRCIGGLPGPS